MPLVDVYGNEQDQIVLIIVLHKSEISKINWVNFDYNNFEKVAITYFEHSVLSK